MRHSFTTIADVYDRYLPQRRTIHFAIITLISVIGLFWYAQVQANAQDARMVTVYVDGTEKTFPTEAETVEQALERAEVSLHDEDLVEPSLMTEITSDSFKINVYRARPVLVIDGRTEHQVLTPYQSPRLIAEDAGLNVYPEDEYDLTRINNFVGERTLGLRLKINRATSIRLNMYGTVELVRTQADTVGEFVAGLNLSTDDGEVVVRPAADQPIKEGMTVHAVAVSADTDVVEESIPFERRMIQDTSRPIGYEDIRTPGRDGSKLVTYKIQYENGQEVKRTVVDSVVIEKPVEEVVVVGADYTGVHPDNAAILAALRMCETHGNYQANTGNGFYGAYQFMASTWNRTAQRMGLDEWNGVLPSQAPPAVQDAFVLDNARASGGGFWSQHPGCSDKLNLPQFPY